MLGTETIVLIELKDIAELCKEKSKRGMVSDSIKIVTKNKTEVGRISGNCVVLENVSDCLY